VGIEGDGIWLSGKAIRALKPKGKPYKATGGQGCTSW
jgi:hypothetical protein